MVIGSGMIATAMRDFFPDDSVCVYAAGVSNSACTDHSEFERERVRLSIALDTHRSAKRFIYFGTCSVEDQNTKDSKYVQHKLSMEVLARSHQKPLVLRLPQVAGRTVNPHTLLNFLHHRIARSEKFQVRVRATRNVIDVGDVCHIAQLLVQIEGAVNETINVAAPNSVPIMAIVEAMERIVGKRPVCEIINEGCAYHIDIGRIAGTVKQAGIDFDDAYLDKTLRKYYARAASGR